MMQDGFMSNGYIDARYTEFTAHRTIQYIVFVMTHVGLCFAELRALCTLVMYTHGLLSGAVERWMV